MSSRMRTAAAVRNACASLEERQPLPAFAERPGRGPPDARLADRDGAWRRRWPMPAPAPGSAEARPALQPRRNRRIGKPPPRPRSAGRTVVTPFARPGGHPGEPGLADTGLARMRTRRGCPPELGRRRLPGAEQVRNSDWRPTADTTGAGAAPARPAPHRRGRGFRGRSGAWPRSAGCRALVSVRPRTPDRCAGRSRDRHDGRDSA